jgi:hypothetical protein
VSGKLLAAAAVACVCFAVTTRPGEAHKPITSKYTYNQDVFAILQARCGACHVAGGIAPMSLMTYAEAFPWSESIHAELVAGHMPPWSSDAGDFKNSHKLSAREFDILVTWAVGGNPAGDLSRRPPPVSIGNEWPLGTPDLALQLPEEVTVPADTLEATREFLLPAGAASGRWIRAVDLLPGTPAMVRSAIVAVAGERPAGAAPADDSGIDPEAVLAVWTPGQTPVAADRGTAFRIPPGGSLLVRVHYRKTWMDQAKPLTDRSVVGLYFADAPATEIRALTLTSPPLASDNREVTFSRAIEEDLHGVALRPDETMGNVALRVDAVRPDGVREAMARLNVRADWAQRYWFAQPIALPRGTIIEVVATPGEPDALVPPASTAAPVKPGAGSTIRVTVNVVSVPST